MYPKVKQEKREHGKLLKAFRKHFKKDESDMESDMENDSYREREGDDDADDEQVKPMTLYQGKKDRRVSLNRSLNKRNEPHSDIYSSDGESTDEDRMYGENAESNDEGYSTTPSDDEEEYEKDQKDEIAEDSQPMLPKAQRKRMSIAVLSKKMSKPRRSA